MHKFRIKGFRQSGEKKIKSRLRSIYNCKWTIFHGQFCEYNQ